MTQSIQSQFDRILELSVPPEGISALSFYKIRSIGSDLQMSRKIDHDTNGHFHADLVDGSACSKYPRVVTYKIYMFVYVFPEITKLTNKQSNQGAIPE